MYNTRGDECHHNNLFIIYLRHLCINTFTIIPRLTNEKKNLQTLRDQKQIFSNFMNKTN